MGIKRDIIISALDENPSYKDVPSSTLARIIYNMYPAHFSSPESIRGMIRAIRGERKDRKGVEGYKTTIKQRQERMGHQKLNLKSEGQKELPTYILPKANKNILLLSDIHIPYHDEHALEHALHYGLDKKCDTIILNGDIMDMYHASTFEKDPRQRSLSYEMDLTRSFFEQLREMFPTQKILYKLGNHEHRWERYLKLKAKEIFDLDHFKLREVLQCYKWNIEVIEQDVLIKIADLLVLHGHETGKSFGSAVNPARSLFNKVHTKSIAGHNHQTSEFIQNQTGKEAIEVFSTGCLCELHPSYMLINKWNHGFAHLQVKNNKVKVDNIRI